MAGGFREVFELTGVWLGATPSVGADGGYLDILGLQGVFLPAIAAAGDDETTIIEGLRRNVGRMMR
jgi:hypothetical protein